MRISQSVGIGPFRVRVSVPVGKRRGRRAYVSAGMPDGIGWLGVSTPVGRARKRRRR